MRPFLRFILWFFQSVSLLAQPGSLLEFQSFRTPSLGNPVQTLIFVPGQAQTFTGYYLAGNFGGVNTPSVLLEVDINDHMAQEGLPFNPDANSATALEVNALAMDAKEQVYVGGSFAIHWLNGSSSEGVTRLVPIKMPDGSILKGMRVDRDFRPLSKGSISAIGVEADGKVILSGAFFTPNEPNRELSMARFLPNGTLDPTFFRNDKEGMEGTITKIAMQRSGMSLASGTFTRFQGWERNSLVRIDASNGVIDQSFDPKLPPCRIDAIKVLPDDTILIAGNFRTVGAFQRRYLAKLDRNGNLIPNFEVPTIGLAPAARLSLETDAKGRIYFGGLSRINGMDHNGLVRLHADGSIDFTFDSSAVLSEGRVDALAIEERDTLGVALTSAELPLGRLSRLRTEGAVMLMAPQIVVQPQSFTGTNGTLLNLTPEVKGFPLSLQWLRDGQPVAGATNAHLSLQLSVATAGNWTLIGSNYLGVTTSTIAKVEVLYEKPVIQQQPQSVSVPAGSEATFQVIATGNPFPHYQWLHNGEVLTGQTNDLLRIPATQFHQEGAYKVRVSNVAGSELSLGATLTLLVEPPRILSELQNVIVAEGGEVVLTVQAFGAPPPAYQWFRNGVPIPGASSKDLVLQNIQVSQAGDYYVTVSNMVAMVQSKTVLVTVKEVENLTVALDQKGFDWTTSGGAPWAFQSTISFDGNSAAQAGGIEDSQVSVLEVRVNGPSSVQFMVKVSSEQGFDGLRLLVDGNQEARFSGEVDWRKYTLVVHEGSHLIRWEYFKDESGSGGADTAWIDQVKASSLKLGITSIGSNSQTLLLNVAAGQTYYLEGSSDLRFWQVIQTGSGTGSLEPLPVKHSNNPQFLRLKIQ